MRRLGSDIEYILEQKRNGHELKLLFLFNGADLIGVESRMRYKIREITGRKTMSIHGSDVLCVWCDSSKLINWTSTIQHERLVADSERVADEMKCLADEKKCLADEKKRMRERIEELEELLKERGGESFEEDVFKSNKRRRRC